MRSLFLILSVLLIALVNVILLNACTGSYTKEIIASPTLDTSRLRKLSTDAFNFCRKKKLNTGKCIFVDMSIPSGKNRLFVWDFREQKIKLGAVVTHGSGTAPWSNDKSRELPVFSNTPDSHCTSLGKCMIGDRGYSQWGMHVKYLLHGLDSTNSNVLKRDIVLHSWEAVPDNEIYPSGAPESWGCPAVSIDNMKRLDTMLSVSGKPMLLWVIN